MTYQARKRLMMTETDAPEFSSPRPSAKPAFAKAAASADRNASLPSKEFRLQELTMLSIEPILRGIHHWWLARAERHYLICADVEEQRAREAQLNVAYYQKRAALARSARMA